ADNSLKLLLSVTWILPLPNCFGGIGMYTSPFSNIRSRRSAVPDSVKSENFFSKNTTNAMAIRPDIMEYGIISQTDLPSPVNSTPVQLKKVAKAVSAFRLKNGKSPPSVSVPVSTSTSMSISMALSVSNPSKLITKTSIKTTEEKIATTQKNCSIPVRAIHQSLSESVIISGTVLAYVIKIKTTKTIEKFSQTGFIDRKSVV